MPECMCEIVAVQRGTFEFENVIQKCSYCLAVHELAREAVLQVAAMCEALEGAYHNGDHAGECVSCQRYLEGKKILAKAAKLKLEG